MVKGADVGVEGRRWTWTEDQGFNRAFRAFAAATRQAAMRAVVPADGLYAQKPEGPEQQRPGLGRETQGR